MIVQDLTVLTQIFTTVQWGISLVVRNVSANMTIMGVSLAAIITLSLIEHGSGKEHN